jgi:LysR family transcriptional regulator, regulator for metE and metH
MEDLTDNMGSMILEVRHLRLMQAIVCEGSMTKASQALHLTQSALSHQLRELEQIFGGPLFLRFKKKMLLTQAGERLLQSADSVLPELHQTEEEIQRLVKGESGLLRISTQCNTCYHWLPAMVYQFDRMFPGVEIRIIPEATSRSVEALLEGKLDLAITYTRIQDKNVLHFPIFMDELLAVMRPDHPLASKSYLKPRDFQNEELITYSISKDSNIIFQKYLGPAGISPRKVYSIMLTEAILEMVEAGIGISILARWVALPYLRSGKLRGIPLSKSGMRRQWYAVTIKSSPASRYAEAFASLLAESAYPSVVQKQILSPMKRRRSRS